MTKLYGGVEAGGTKWVCAAGLGPNEIHAQARIPTTTPGETIKAAIDFFRQVQQSSPLAALGIGSLGPGPPPPPPAETIKAAIDFFRQVQQSSPLAALGIGSFGPVDPQPRSETYGNITSTP